MAGKTYEMAFKLAGKLDNSLKASFTTTSEKMQQLSRKTAALRQDLRNLEKAQKTGKIDNQEFANSYAKLTKQIEKAEFAQRKMSIATQLQSKASAAQAKITSAMSGIVGKVVMGASILGPGVLGINSLKKAMNFETEMSTIQALAGLTGEQMIAMQNLALKMGAATKYNAMEAAQGIEELLKAGLSPATVQAGGLEAALNLATAGGLDLAAAAEIMSTSLNAFKGEGLQAANASNILAGTANASATSVEELRYSLSMVSAVAAGVGMSFADTNVALGLLANNGLKGSDAGTSLKSMLTKLQPAAKKQTDLFKKLGLITADGSNQFYTAEGRLKSLDEITGVLTNSLEGLTDQERMAYLQTLFGTDAIRAANILYNEGADGVKQFRGEMEKVSALDVARQKMNNASGAVEQFSGALETLQISAMLPFLPVVKKVAEGAASITEKYSPQIIAAMERTAKKVEAFFDRLSKDEEFQKLDWGDKIVRVLDEMMIAMDNWVSGDGGDKVGKVFTKLAEIGVRSWMAALGGMAKGSVGAAASGNLVGAGGLALAAGLMGGGMVVRGGWAAGKGAVNAGKWLAKNKHISYTGGAVATEAAAAGKAGATASKALPGLGKVAKVAGRAAIPVMVAAEAYDIYKAEDKATAAAKSIGGIGAGLAGAKLGAVIGTAILPGIGTAVGGALGGLGGYLAGKWGIGKVMGEGKGPAALDSSTTEAAAAAGQAAEGYSNLADKTQGVAETTGTYDEHVRQMQENIIYGGWLFSTALTKAAERTDRLAVTGVPGMAGYAAGGFASTPSIFGEAGFEAAIPIDGSRRSLGLWERTGELLGVNKGDIYVTYAPVIHGAGPEIMPEMDRQQRSFMDQLKQVLAQQRRVSYA